MWPSVVAAFYLCSWVVEAQYAFKVPDPTKADLDGSLTIVQNTVVNFIWLANSTYQPTLDGKPLLDADGHISVWLTSWTDNVDFGKCLAASIYSGEGGSWAWKVDLPDEVIDRYKGKFTYRLKPPVSSVDTPFVDDYSQVPSRGFIIRKQSEVAASSASVAASKSAAIRSLASPTSSSFSTQTTQSVQTTTTADSGATTTSSDGAPGATGAATSNDIQPTNQSNGGGLAGGAIAGIVIGALAIVLLAAIAILLFLKHRRNTAQPAELNAYAGQAYRPHEKPNYSELNDPNSQQVYAYSVPPPNELSTGREHDYSAELAGHDARKH